MAAAAEDTFTEGYSSKLVNCGSIRSIVSFGSDNAEIINPTPRKA